MWFCELADCHLSRKAGAGSLFRCRSSQINPGAFTLGLLLWYWEYVQRRGHTTFSQTLIQHPEAACLTYFPYVPFSHPVSALLPWKENATSWAWWKEVRRSFGTNQNPHWWETCEFFRRLTSGLLWTGQRVWEEWMDGCSSSSESKGEGCWHAEGILNVALRKPHYTLRGILVSLSPDSRAAKLFVDQ